MGRDTSGYASAVQTVGHIVGGRYLLREVLGRGGMAEVYRATDTATDRGMAVKILRSVEPGDAGRFRSEAYVLSLLDHPHVVRLHGSGTHEGVPYLVLDLAEGGSLAAELTTGPLPLAGSLVIGEQVAEALAHAHGQGIVHRDVKPSNILFDAGGQVRVADFGIARLAGSASLTRTGQVVGTGLYLAPEQVAGDAVGPEADVYSLGLVVLECVTGSPCYSGGHVEAAVARLHRPPAVPPELPRWVREVLAAMTAREPGRRPAASDVATALRRRRAGPVLASTAVLDLTAVTLGRATQAGPVGGRNGASIGSHAGVVRPPTGMPGSALDGSADATVVDEPVEPADRTEVLPPSRVPREGGRRLATGAQLPGGRRRPRPSVLLLWALVTLVAVAALAWTASRDGASVDPAPSGSTVPSTTTLTTAPPPTVDRAPAPPPEDGGGAEQRGKGKDKDKDKGKSDD